MDQNKGLLWSKACSKKHQPSCPSESGLLTKNLAGSSHLTCKCAQMFLKLFSTSASFERHVKRASWISQESQDARIISLNGYSLKTSMFCWNNVYIHTLPEWSRGWSASNRCILPSKSLLANCTNETQGIHHHRHNLWCISGPWKALLLGSPRPYWLSFPYML